MTKLDFAYITAFVSATYALDRMISYIDGQDGRKDISPRFYPTSDSSTSLRYEGERVEVTKYDHTVLIQADNRQLKIIFDEEGKPIKTEQAFYFEPIVVTSSTVRVGDYQFQIN